MHMQNHYYAGYKNNKLTSHIILIAFKLVENSPQINIQ